MPTRHEPGTHPGYTLHPTWTTLAPRGMEQMLTRPSVSTLTHHRPSRRNGVGCWLRVAQRDGRGGAGQETRLCTVDTSPPAQLLTKRGELEAKDGILLAAQQTRLTTVGWMQPLLAAGQAQDHPVLVGAVGQAHDLRGHTDSSLGERPPARLSPK